jgi:hypothetical protein
MAVIPVSNISGNIDVKEIERLIKKLELDKKILVARPKRNGRGAPLRPFYGGSVPGRPGTAL